MFWDSELVEIDGRGKTAGVLHTVKFNLAIDFLAANPSVTMNLKAKSPLALGWHTLMRTVVDSGGQS